MRLPPVYSGNLDNYLIENHRWQFEVLNELEANLYKVESVLTSPDGSRWRQDVSNAGVLTLTKLT